MHLQLYQHGRQLLQAGDSSDHLIHIHGEPSMQHCSAVDVLQLLTASMSWHGRLQEASWRSNSLPRPPAGWLMAASWGFLIPIGVTLAIFRSVRGMRPWWFYLHSVIQTLGFLLSLAGIGVGAQLNIDQQLQRRHRQAPGPLRLHLDPAVRHKSVSRLETQGHPMGGGKGAAAKRGCSKVAALASA